MIQRVAHPVFFGLSRAAPSRQRVRLWLVLTLLALGLPGLTGFVAAAEEPAAAPAASPEQPDFQKLLATLRQSKLDAARRREAVTALLDCYRQQATEVLARELGPEGDAATQQVIAQALGAWAEDPPAELAWPLLGLLDRADEAFLNDLAVALGQFDDHRLIRRLAETAGDPAAPIARRRGCIQALSYHRSQYNAKALMQLIQPNQPAVVRSAAFQGLAFLTGIDDFGSDLGRWQRWWEQHRRLSEEQWFEELLTIHARRQEQAANQTRKLQGRVVELQRQLYRATAQEARPALLVAMLSDPLEPCRELAIDLVVQRLTDAQPVVAPLREALLARLDDPSAVIRQGTARILRELADTDGADAVAQRLVEGQEADPGVLRAYLLVMARVPRAAAVETAIGFLGDAAMGAQAAAAVGKAVEAKLLTPEQLVEVTARLHDLIGQDGVPDPRVIELLGRLAVDSDWERMAKWLDDTDAAVRAAAATAWAQSSQSLEPLARRAGDMVIRPILIEAATRRGSDGATLRVLVRHKPEQEQALLAWQRCLVTMAARVEPEATLEADGELIRQVASLALRDQFLSAAIGHLLPEIVPAPATTTPATLPATHPAAMPAVLLDLLLSRGELRLTQGDANQALADFRRVLEAQPSPSQAQAGRADWGLFRASLAAGDADGAFNQAKRILAAAPSDAGLKDSVVQAFLGTAQHSLATGQAESARKALRQLREILGAPAPGVLAKIVELEDRAGILRPAPLAPEILPPATAPAEPQRVGVNHPKG